MDNEPFPSWTSLFCAALLGVVMTWVLLNAIEKAAYDAATFERTPHGY